MLSQYYHGEGEVYFVIGSQATFKFRVTMENNRITILEGWTEFTTYYRTNMYDYTIHLSYRGDSIFDVTMTCHTESRLQNKKAIMLQMVDSERYEADLHNMKYNDAPSFEETIRAYPLYGQVLPLYSATRSRLVSNLLFRFFHSLMFTASVNHCLNYPGPPCNFLGGV